MNATPGPQTHIAESQDFTISAFGVPVSVEISGNRAHELAAEVNHVWERCSPVRETSRGGGAGPVVRVLLDSDQGVVDSALAGQSAGQPQVFASTSLDEISGLLVSAVTAAALEAAAGQLLLLHAAAVCDRATGATVVLAGPSGMGKSTAARLLGTSLGYVTDETVALAADLTLHPYPKPLSLFPDGRTWGKKQHSPGDLGLLEPPTTLHLAGIVLLERSEEAPEIPELTPLSTVEATVGLGPHTSYLSHLDRPLHRLAEAASCGAGAHLLRYRASADLLPAIKEVVATSALQGAPAPLAVVPALADDVPVAAQAALAAAPLDDLLATDQGGAAFHGGLLVGLSPIALHVLQLVQTSAQDLESLTEALTSTFGTPTEGEPIALTAEIVTDLLRNGLLLERDDVTS